MAHPIGKACKRIHPGVSHAVWHEEDKKRTKEGREEIERLMRDQYEKRKEFATKVKKQSKVDPDAPIEVTPPDKSSILAEPEEKEKLKYGGKTKSKKSSHYRGYSQYN